MSLNALDEVRKALGVGDQEKPRVMTIAERNADSTVVTDSTGSRISIDGISPFKDGDSVIVSGGKILGRAESSAGTVWID